jgi:type IV pilus assembly protein PilX
MNKTNSAQRGLVLPIVLIFLVIMMLLGTAMIRNVTLEEKMAGNMRNRNLAFQAAEQALRFCETSVQLGNMTALNLKLNAEGPIKTGANAGKNYWELKSYWADPNFAVTVPPVSLQSSGAALASAPQCMVEVITAPITSSTSTAAQDRDNGNQKTQFRVTARGVGLDANTVVQLQSYIVL